MSAVARDERTRSNLPVGPLMTQNGIGAVW